jgi:hypothetical protein
MNRERKVLKPSEVLRRQIGQVLDHRVLRHHHRHHDRHQLQVRVPAHLNSHLQNTIFGEAFKSKSSRILAHLAIQQ